MVRSREPSVRISASLLVRLDIKVLSWSAENEESENSCEETEPGSGDGSVISITAWLLESLLGVCATEGGMPFLCKSAFVPTIGVFSKSLSSLVYFEEVSTVSLVGH
jgi:hypothetical protein